MFKSRGAEKFSRLLREFYFECGIDTFFYGWEGMLPEKNVVPLLFLCKSS